MRLVPIVLVLLAAASAFAQDAVTPESLLRRGLASYQGRDYTSAVTDLQAAAQGFLTPEQMQAYVNTGRFDRLQSFETSLVYLALSQFHLGREDDARETLLRLQSAERITPTYAGLSIGSDATMVLDERHARTSWWIARFSRSRRRSSESDALAARERRHPSRLVDM